MNTTKDKNMRYTFGTNDIAAQRLQKVADIFNPHSMNFIRKYAGYPVVSAVDLGCGPGFTTHMLYMALSSREVYGLDNSEEFILKAMRRFEHCVFIRHDLSETPFPVSPEIMYVRFVLSHLPNPVRYLNSWSMELSHNGMLFVEEVEEIETDIPVFQRYLALNRGLVASQGSRLYVGKEISEGSYNLDVLVNECFELTVGNCDAAAMFYPNTVSIWEKERYVLDTLAPAQRREISGQMREIMNSNDKSAGVTWKMRRMVLKNTEYGQYYEMFI